MTQECSYREMFITCMQSGAPLPVSLESHEGEKIKEQLKQYSASNIGEEQQQELLWIRRQEETADRGFYHRYKPDGNIAVSASPVMMAFLMGEYGLAEKLLENGASLHADDTAMELSISESTTFIGNCSYTFFCLWFMDRDIPERLYILSLRRVICPEIYFYKPYLADDFGRMPDDENEKNLTEAIGRLYRVDAGMACYLAEELINGLLGGKIIKDYVEIWDELFVIFADEREELIQIVYGFFLDCIFHQRHAQREFGRMTEILGIFFKYQKHITLSGYVFAFIWKMMMSCDYMCGIRECDLFGFMQMVPHFREPPFPAVYRKERDMCIKRMMEYGSGYLIKECFRNGFLKTELIEEYMDLALTALSPYRKSYIVPRLLVLNCKTGGYAKNKIQFCIEELKSEYVEFLYPLSRINLKEGNISGIFTDGTCIYYCPRFVTNSSVREVKYRIMHIIMHGILGHFEKNRELKSKTQKQSGWAVMDAQVWWILDRMGMEIKNIGSISYADEILGGQYDFSHCKRAEENELYAFRLRAAGVSISVDDHKEWGKNKDSYAQCILSCGKETGLADVIWSYLKLQSAHAHSISFMQYYRQCQTGITLKEIDDILSGIGFEKYREKITKELSFRQQWILTDNLCDRLVSKKTKEEVETTRYKEIAGWMSNVLDLIKEIDEKDILCETAFQLINKKELLLKVVSSVKVTEYMELCDKFLGDVSELTSA